MDILLDCKVYDVLSHDDKDSFHKVYYKVITMRDKLWVSLSFTSTRGGVWHYRPCNYNS